MSWAVPDAACKHLTDTGYELEASMPLAWSSILFAGSWKSTSLLIEKTSKLPWKMQYATPLGDTCQPCWCPAVCGLVSISMDCESTRYSDKNKIFEDFKYDHEDFKYGCLVESRRVSQRPGKMGF